MCPWDLRKSSNDWTPIARKVYTNEDLLAVNIHFYHHQHTLSLFLSLLSPTSFSLSSFLRFFFFLIYSSYSLLVSFFSLFPFFIHYFYRNFFTPFWCLFALGSEFDSAVNS